MQEDDVVTCPLHGAKFDVKTGAVLAPPGHKRVASYKTKVAGDSIEVMVGEETPGEKNAEPKAPAPSGPKLFDGARQNLGYVITASALALLFWALQFAYIYLISVPGDLQRSLILASSF